MDVVLYLSACLAGTALGWFTGKLCRSLRAPRWAPSALRLGSLAGAVVASVGLGLSLVLLVTALGFSLGDSLATRPPAVPTDPPRRRTSRQRRRK